ncbi:MAG TPA: IclR family transcriptional regulator [Rhodopila sp.]|uniref:IclR family transcriptional regulator n=1 Tax=Rhodopila sp. TaxID=2480087 RepID=UPI002C512294|nr:IclR family transcriptional regulator [Rhodopila sp.]HVY17799.1 IclR family transcriptional regulator [Rhodopila sp.]
MTRTSGTQALERAIALLEAIANAPEDGVKLADVAEACAIEQPTAHRIATRLESSGLVARVGDSKRFCLGPRLFQLAMASAEGGGLLGKARPSLLRLAVMSGDCVFLMVRSGLDAVCLDRQDGDYTIRSLTGRIGGATPLGLGTGSVTILSYLPAEERLEILAGNRTRIEASGHPLPTEEEMAAIRACGHSYEVSTTIAGVVGVAVPILTPKGRPLGALALGATEARLPADRLDVIVAMMEKERREIEQSVSASRVLLEPR